MGIPIKRDASSLDETGSRVKRKASGGFKNSYIQVRCSDQVTESAADWVANLLFVLRRIAQVCAREGTARRAKRCMSTQTHKNVAGLASNVRACGLGRQTVHTFLRLRALVQSQA